MTNHEKTLYDSGISQFPPDAGYNQRTGRTPISRPPPVKQTLIPEGFFAIKLADALKLGPAETEAEAETTLTSLGIMPGNGWIADYPVTPDVLIELQNAAAWQPIQENCRCIGMKR